MNNAKFLVPLLGLLGLTRSFDACADINAWSFINPTGGGATVDFVASHPTNGSIAVAGTPSGIFRTADAGQSWTLVKDDTPNEPRNGAFDPSDPHRVIVHDWQSGLYLSNDAGQTFGLMQGPTVPANDVIGFIEFGPNGKLYVMTIKGTLFSSAAPFTNWTTVASGLVASTSSIMFMNVDPANAQVLYIGIYQQGICRSTDGGQTWSAPFAAGVANPQTTSFHNVSIDPADPTRLLVSTGLGVYLSTDGGATGSWVNANLAYWTSFDPRDPGVAYALVPNQLLRSVNRGQTWTAVWNHRASSASNVAFPPGGSGTLLIATPQGIGYSADAGISVTYRNSGLTGFLARALVANDHDVLLSAPLGLGDIFRLNGSNFVPLDPAPLQAATTLSREFRQLAVAAADSNQIFTVNSGQELVRTFDGGAHWTAPHPAFLASGDPIKDLKIDPSNPLVAYVSRSSGVWKTVDGGTSFTQLVNSPADTGVLGINPHDGSIFVATHPYGLPAIYKSGDGGLTWVEKIPAPATNDRNYWSFTFHPTDPKTIYIAAFYGGVYKSTDAGDTWQHVYFDQSIQYYVSAYSVLIDPMVPSTLFVVSTGNQPGFLRSVDNGVTWSATYVDFPGVRGGLGDSVLDPRNPDTLISVTSTLGIATYQVAPDLGLAMTPLANAVPRGGSVSSTFTVTNNGPHASSLSAVLIDVPSWMTPSGPGCTPLGQSVTCAIGAIMVGQSKNVVVNFAVAANAAGSGQVHATLQTHEVDPETSNNEVSQAVQAAEIADVDVAIAAGSSTIDRGGSTHVTVTVSNSGPSPSTSTLSTVTLPTNASASNLVSSVGNCTQNSGVITCALGTLAADASATLTFGLRGDTAGQGTLSASAAGAGQDTDGQHSGSLAITVRPVADMAVALAESSDPVTLGAPFQYTATVSNLSGDAGAFIVSVPVAGARVLGASADFGACTTTNSGATCSGTGLAAAATGVMTLNLDSNTAGIATATATVNFSGADSDPANNSANIGTTIRVVGDLSVELAESADPVIVGRPLSYTATVHNLGPNAGNAHLLVDITGATAASVTPSAGGICTTVLTQIRVDCDFNGMASGATATATIALTTAAAGTASATAQVSFSDTDPVLTNNSATVSTAVNTAPSSSSSSSGGGGGGGGGGGRFDWLAAGVLALLLGARQFNRRGGLAAGA